MLLPLTSIPAAFRCLCCRRWWGKAALGGAARSDLELELLKPPAPRPPAPSWLEAVPQCWPGAAPGGTRAIGG